MKIGSTEHHQASRLLLQLPRLILLQALVDTSVRTVPIEDFFATAGSI